MEVDLSLDRLRRTLRAPLTAPPPASVLRGAAVAAVLREGAGGPELLFIRRAEHPRDPWSGHMGWPGGRIDDGDPNPLATAIRETREELGLDLERDGDLLGALPIARTHLRRGSGPRHVAPYVFAVRGSPALALNDEVQEVVWVPLAFLLDRDNRGHFVWTAKGIPLVLPCFRFEGRIIWGLTLKMLDELLKGFVDSGQNTADR